MTANKTTISKDSNENWHQTDTLTFQMHTGYFFFLNRVQYSFSEMIHHETWLVGYFLSLKRKSKYSLASDMFLCILHTMYVPRLLNLLLMYSMLWILWFRANTIFLVLKEIIFFSFIYFERNDVDKGRYSEPLLVEQGLNLAALHRNMRHMDKGERGPSRRWPRFGFSFLLDTQWFTQPSSHRTASMKGHFKVNIPVHITHI